MQKANLLLFFADADSFADWDEVYASYDLSQAVARAASEALNSPKAAEKVLSAAKRAQKMKRRGQYCQHALHMEVARVLKCVCTQWVVVHCLKTVL